MRSDQPSSTLGPGGFSAPSRSGSSASRPRGAPSRRWTARSPSARYHSKERRQCSFASAVLGPVVAPQEIGAELVEARAADLAHHEIDLAAEDVDRLLDAGQPAGDGAVERRAAEKHELGAQAKRDQD